MPSSTSFFMISSTSRTAPVPEEAAAKCREAVRPFAADVRRDDVTCVAVALAEARSANHRTRPPSEIGFHASVIGGTVEDVQLTQVIIS